MEREILVIGIIILISLFGIRISKKFKIPILIMFIFIGMIAGSEGIGGIYFDNAIEASAESRKKNLTVEVYELKDKVRFVFSNTFKRHKNMKDRNKKGVSSKGESRGNGLYFASKLIKENPWLEEKQEIIDGYYIEQLTIKKNINE